MNRKAQGLEMSFIIKAILGLIILGISIYLIFTKTVIFQKSTTDTCDNHQIEKAYTYGCDDDESTKIIKLDKTITINGREYKKGSFVKCCVKI